MFCSIVTHDIHFGIIEIESFQWSSQMTFKQLFQSDGARNNGMTNVDKKSAKISTLKNREKSENAKITTRL